jgi:hypothetical protein
MSDSDSPYGLSYEGDNLKVILGDLRLYLTQFGYGAMSMTPEEVRDRVIFFLDEYRRLQAWANSRPYGVTCGAFAGTGIPPGFGVHT